MTKVTLNEAQMSLYLENENDNSHTENLVLLAAVSGDSDLFQRALRLLELRNKKGCIDGYLKPLQTYLLDNLKLVNYGAKF